MDIDSLGEVWTRAGDYHIIRFVDRQRNADILRRGGRAVEGGRLEIVLAVLSRYVGSNPTLSANSILIAERWLSGRRRSPGERVDGLNSVSRVQIPPSPPILDKQSLPRVIRTL